MKNPEEKAKVKRGGLSVLNRISHLIGGQTSINLFNLKNSISFNDKVLKLSDSNIFHFIEYSKATQKYDPCMMSMVLKKTTF